MNDKIKTLAEQAGFMLWQKESWNPGDVIDWSARYDNELELFAKLMVLECAKLCEQNAVYLTHMSLKDDMTASDYLARADESGECASLILQHFDIHE